MHSSLKMTKARANLIMGNPFFGTLALRLKMAENPKIKTAYVDGQTLYYNPEFIDSLDNDRTQGLVAGCAMHVALLHHTRRGARDVKKWNKACDYAINPILRDCGFTLPEDTCYDKSYEGMAAEHIYSLMPPGDDDNKGGGAGGGSGSGEGGASSPGSGDGDSDNNDPGGNGGVEDSPNSQNQGGSAAQEAQEEAEWKSALAEAAQAARQAGKLPGGIERIMEDVLKQVLPWRDVLRRFMTEKANDDFNWNRPNRRLISQGIYLPSRESEGSGEIVVCIDTSGSLTADDLADFGAEIRSIVEDARPSLTRIIYCDARVNKVVEFGPSDELVFEMVGGGGTDFRPPFHYLEENGITPKVLVYLTDGYGPFPERESEFPVMWAINNYDVTPPWGEHLIVEMS